MDQLTTRVVKGGTLIDKPTGNYPWRLPSDVRSIFSIFSLFLFSAAQHQAADGQS